MPAHNTKEIIQLAADVNALLFALMDHPAMDRTNPAASPRPLFFTTDFVRRTYLEYLVPILPQEALLKSSKIANQFLIRYGDDQPLPQEPNDAWLEDLSNWPSDRNSRKSRELFTDAVGRSTLIASMINDPVKGAMIMQGQFDWENPVNIKALTAPFL